MNTIEEILENAEIVFIENRLPGVLSGDYKIEAKQSVSVGDKTLGGEEHQQEQLFHVKGRRYELDPLDVYSTYPPKNYEGNISTVLPHVVLTAPTIPWQRTVSNSEYGTFDIPSYKIDGVQIPWLALLVFDEDDLVSKPININLIKLRDTDSNTFTADREQESIEKDEDLVTVIDVDVNLFKNIAPSAADLIYLSHIREVSILQKELKLEQPLNIIEEDLGITIGDKISKEFSVVVGNRLPKVGGRTTVHLVSLENMRKYLPGEETEYIWPAEIETIRLVTFKNWSFSCTEKQRTLKDYVENLNGEFNDPIDLQLPSPLNEKIKAPIEMGFVPFNHQTRGGDNTVSWYRGPLVPYKVKPHLAYPIPSADSITAYDPKTGMFNTGYPAAWELGRLLALQEKQFSLKLYNWKRETKQDVIHYIEQVVLANALTEDLAKELDEMITEEQSNKVSHTLSAVTRGAKTKDKSLIQNVVQNEIKSLLQNLVKQSPPTQNNKTAE
jgi:hypothetical protein